MHRDRAASESPLFRRPRAGWRAHAAALAALTLVLALRFHAQLLSPGARPDERVYLKAFRAVAAGVSPYLPAADGLEFFYPPSFAALGAGALELVDERGVVLALRGANLLGLAACLWLSFLFAPLRRAGCLAAAAGYAALAPPALQHGFGSGNFSFAAAGAALVGLASWWRAPAAAGLLLAFASVTKPLAPAGVAILALHRSRSGGRSHVVAAGAAIALAGALTLWSPFLAEYLAHRSDPRAWPLSRSISLLRGLQLAGLPATPFVTFAAVTLAAVVVARRAPLEVRQLFVLASAAMTLAAPALWSHTLLLALPLEVMAVGRAWSRRRAPQAAATALARFELPLVLLAVASLQFADGIGGGVERAPAPLALVVLAVPLGAVLALAAYLWPASDPRRDAARAA